MEKKKQIKTKKTTQIKTNKQEEKKLNLNKYIKIIKKMTELLIFIGENENLRYRKEFEIYLNEILKDIKKTESEE